MSISEDPQATWDKRFKSRHYSYRDFHTVATGPIAAIATYIFGTNARNISRYNWPTQGDFTTLTGPRRLTCYAREVMVQCTEDAWVILTSLNPEYLILINIGYTTAQIAALGVPIFITEVALFIPRNALITLHPTYGYAISFYQDTASGTIRIWVDGNVEGTE